MSHPIRPLSCLQSAVFLINSPSHLVTATPNCSIRKGLHCQERTFSRSYGSILPSSFTRVLSSALVFSTRPPVSVWGTVSRCLKLRGFSWKHGINHFASHGHSSSVLGLMESRIYLRSQPTTLNADNQTPRWPSLLRPLIAVPKSTGILTCFPSTTAFALALGAD